MLKNVILEGSFTTPAYLSPECTHLIKAILRRKPEARLSLEGISGQGWLGEGVRSGVESH